MTKFFDLDNTITESKQIISKEMKEKLLSLGETFIVISGASKEQIEKQMDGIPCVVMGQSGNDAPDWMNKLTDKEVKTIWDHLRKVSEFCLVPLDGETVEHRGCQISLSFTGHNAPSEWKKKFDPSKEFRKHVLENVPFRVKGLNVRIAGTTCLDYNRKGCLKGNNLKRYMRLHRLKKKDCIYYGDNLQKGGNDESVIGVMQTVAVKNPNDLMKKLCVE